MSAVKPGQQSRLRPVSFVCSRGRRRRPLGGFRGPREALEQAMLAPPSGDDRGHLAAAEAALGVALILAGHGLPFIDRARRACAAASCLAAPGRAAWWCLGKRGEAGRAGNTECPIEAKRGQAARAARLQQRVEWGIQSWPIASDAPPGDNGAALRSAEYSGPPSEHALQHGIPAAFHSLPNTSPLGLAGSHARHDGSPPLPLPLLVANLPTRWHLRI